MKPLTRSDFDFDEIVSKLKNTEPDDFYPKNYGTRSGEPTHLCDINTGLSQFPDFIKDRLPILKEIENYVHNEVGYQFECNVMKGNENCRITFRDGMKRMKKPSLFSDLSTFRYVVGDCGFSMQSLDETKQIGDKLREFAEKFDEVFKSLKFSHDEADKVNDMINKYWVERWYQTFAWDFDDGEKTFLDNPYEVK